MRSSKSCSYSSVCDASTGCGGSATKQSPTYTLSFAYGSGQLAATASEFPVLWRDPNAPSLSTVADVVDVNTFGDYDEYTTTITVPSATSELEFPARQDFDFYCVNDVLLTAPAEAGVPEPGPAVSLMVGIAVIWARRNWLSKLRRTRKRTPLQL